MREHDRAGRGRGWGPFTGRQLTLIVCVAIVAMVLLPSAAIAVGGSFTSKSNATPGLHGVNTGSNGIGVVGTRQALWRVLEWAARRREPEDD